MNYLSKVYAFTESSCFLLNFVNPKTNNFNIQTRVSIIALVIFSTIIMCATLTGVYLAFINRKISQSKIAENDEEIDESAFDHSFVSNSIICDKQAVKKEEVTSIVIKTEEIRPTILQSKEDEKKQLIDFSEKLDSTTKANQDDSDSAFLVKQKKREKISTEKNIEERPICCMISKQYDCKIDWDLFTEFLLSDKNLISQVKILLENTVLKGSIPKLPVSVHHIQPNGDDVKQALNSLSFARSTILVSLESKWFDYALPHHFYIDFAHATSFGGAYNSYGCVQEERMFAEFPVLPILDYITQNGIHPCVDSYEHGGHQDYPPKAKACPFIIESISREFDISNTPYGGLFQKAKDDVILNGIKKINKPVSVNIIGLAAKDFRGIKNAYYKMDDLIYHFEAAYLGDVGAQFMCDKKGWGKAVVHTAPWGCGAFLNSEKMITAIQYLAARKADIDLVFHGIGNPMNPAYTEVNIKQIIDLIEDLIKQQKTSLEILEILLFKSQSDPSWAPK